ncbi:hypothetical protein BJX64DRAFT_272761 [Aspergillus heterothallicus]
MLRSASLWVFRTRHLAFEIRAVILPACWQGTHSFATFLSLVTVSKVTLNTRQSIRQLFGARTDNTYFLSAM